MFKERVKSLRKSKGLTQTELAKELGVSTGTVAMWESGKRKPSFEVMEKLCSFFGVSMNNITGDASGGFQAIEEVAVWLDAQPEVEDLEYFFKKYLALDHFGKEAVNKLIQSELYRCESQRTLMKNDNYVVDVRLVNDESPVDPSDVF